MNRLVSAAPRAVPFGRVAAGFFALLAIGLALGFVVYKKYVAYRSTVLSHIPAEAALVVRLDLTHVMLYEPARRSLLPLADWGAPTSPRAPRLAEHGVRLGADVRELLLATGANPHDWLLAAGGHFANVKTADALAAVLAEEGRPPKREADSLYALGPHGPYFSQASDGTFLMASTRRWLHAALAAQPSHAGLAEGAGGVDAQRAVLGSPWTELHASLRAGSFVSVSGRGSTDGSAAARAALQALFAAVAGIDPILRAPIDSSSVEVTGNELKFGVNLPREAVERLARWAAEHAPAFLERPVE